MKSFALALLLVVAPAAMAATKTYQVTGPIADVRDDAIVIEKGKEKWEISRDANTKVKGDLKKGAKATVEYRMSASEIEIKGDKGAAKEGAKSAPPKGGEKGTGAPAR